MQNPHMAWRWLLLMLLLGPAAALPAATAQAQRVRVVSIGPATSERCHAVLGRVDREADPHDLEGLVAACVEALRAPR